MKRSESSDEFEENLEHKTKFVCPAFWSFEIHMLLRWNDPLSLLFLHKIFVKNKSRNYFPLVVAGFLLLVATH